MQYGPPSRDPATLQRVLGLLKDKERDPRSVSLTRLLDAIVTADPAHSLAGTVDWMTRHFRWVIEFEAGLRHYHRIRYEDLVGGHVGDLEDYLGFPLPGAAEVAPEHDHVPRTKSSGDWKNWFVEEDVVRFRPVFAAYLRRYGYDLDWSPSARPFIRPEHGSQYVARVVAKRRGR